MAYDAEAKTKRKSAKKAKAQVTRTVHKGLPELTPGNRYSEIVVDSESGQILSSKHSYDPRYPASLTKMMTLYLTFEALEQGRLSLYQRLPVSAYAASRPQTNISLRPGETITVKDAIMAMVVRSANDASVVVAEKLGGSESGFASMMTRKAKQLGMTDTTFRNANGLPDARQRTTARDMAMLGLALKHHYPQYFGFFSTDTFRFKGQVYRGHNRVMNRFAGADGIKTGYTAASGFNLVSSATRGGRSVIAVVMGGSSAASRDNQMIALLNRTFNGMSVASSPRSAVQTPQARQYSAGDANEGAGQPRKPLKLPTAATPKIQVAAAVAKKITIATTVPTPRGKPASLTRSAGVPVPKARPAA